MELDFPFVYPMIPPGSTTSLIFGPFLVEVEEDDVGATGVDTVLQIHKKRFFNQLSLRLYTQKCSRHV